MNREQILAAYEIARSLEDIEDALKHKPQNHGVVEVAAHPGFTNSYKFSVEGEELLDWLEKLKDARLARLQALGVEL